MQKGRIHMRTLALLLMICVPLGAHAPGYWNRSGVPLPYAPARVYLQQGRGVSTGTAVLGAIAAGVIGWEIGRRQQSKPQPVIIPNGPVKSPSGNCKLINIDGDRRLVCRDAEGDWQLE